MAYFLIENKNVLFSIRGKTEPKLIAPLLIGAFEQLSHQTGLLGTLNTESLHQLTHSHPTNDYI